MPYTICLNRTQTYKQHEQHFGPNYHPEPLQILLVPAYNRATYKWLSFLDPKIYILERHQCILGTCLNHLLVQCLFVIHESHTFNVNLLDLHITEKRKKKKLLIFHIFALNSQSIFSF